MLSRRHQEGPEQGTRCQASPERELSPPLQWVAALHPVQSPDQVKVWDPEPPKDSTGGFSGFRARQGALGLFVSPNCQLQTRQTHTAVLRVAGMEQSLPG